MSNYAHRRAMANSLNLARRDDASDWHDGLHHHRDTASDDVVESPRGAGTMNHIKVWRH